MITEQPDPLIHVPARLKIAAALAAQPGGGPLSFIRLQEMIGLTPGNLIVHLRKLEKVGYVATQKTGKGTATKTIVTLTGQGRAALGAYTQALCDLLGNSCGDRTPPRPQHHAVTGTGDAPGIQDSTGVAAAGAGADSPPGAHASATPGTLQPSHPADRIRRAPHSQTPT